MNLVNITFEEIYNIWETKLWTDRQSPIKHISSMLYGGGYDMSIYNNKPTFFAIKENDQIIAVNSGHMTVNHFYRSRGLYVDEKYRSKGLTYILFTALYEQAKKEAAEYIWSYPKQNSVGAYIKNGFAVTSTDCDNELGPHYYVNRPV